MRMRRPSSSTQLKRNSAAMRAAQQMLTVNACEELECSSAGRLRFPSRDGEVDAELDEAEAVRASESDWRARKSECTMSRAADMRNAMWRPSSAGFEERLESKLEVGCSEQNARRTSRRTLSRRRAS